MIVTEAAIRLGAFAGVFVVMAVWEAAAPKRHQAVSRTRRWVSNVGIAAINTFLLRLVLPAGAGAVALFAEAHSWGLFHIVAAPDWFAFIATVLVLDLTVYFLNTAYSIWRRCFGASIACTMPIQKST